MMVDVICFGESSTNTFHLPCEMITLTLFDMTRIVVLRPTRETFNLTLINKTRHNFTLPLPSHSTFIKDHYASIDNVSSREHIVFLT